MKNLAIILMVLGGIAIVIPPFYIAFTLNSLAAIVVLGLFIAVVGFSIYMGDDL